MPQNRYTLKLIASIKAVKIFVFLICLLAELGCVNRQRQISFQELKDAHQADREQVVRIYIDKRGQIYPDNVYIPYRDFFKSEENGSTYKLSLYTGNLEYYFSKDSTVSKELTDRYGLNFDPLNLKENFRSVQEYILKKKTWMIDQLLNNIGPEPTLIVMIHGFNDPNPSGDFDRLKNEIREYKNIKKAVYLEIYWDGLTSNQGNPGTSRIWRAAQLNSAYVANKLRLILNGLKQNTHIRLISHSLGASVATGALFNTISKWPDPVNQLYYQQMMNTAAPEQKDIRLGMIAPAIPGKSTFTDFNLRKGKAAIQPINNNVHKVVIGFKETDYALLKGFFNKRKYLSKVGGATSLGCNAKTKGVGEIKRVEDELSVIRYPNPTSIIRRVDFNSNNTPYEKEHGLYYYMKNKKALHLFLDELFD